MGNNQSYQSGRSFNIENIDRSQPNLCSQSTIINTDPLKNYTKYKSSMPIKTLSSIISHQRQQQNKNIFHFKQQSTKNKSKTEKKVTQQQNQSEESNQSSQQENSFLNPNKSKKDKQVTNIRDRNNFRAMTIKVQSFIKLKQEPVENFYQIKQVIGEGSFGKVYRALCKITQEQRAIKMIKSKFLKDNKKKQFMAEMNILSKLNHPSIITLYDIFFYSNKYFVVMEYCKGGAVVDMIHLCKKKSQKIISTILKQLFSALAYMHDMSIIHRDIKLDNIVFLHPISQQQGDVDQYIPIKIIDFGSAVQSKFKIVQNFPIAGTLSYLAPEVMKGTLTQKSDMWSSGVLMIILLTGKSPFRGKNQKQTKQNINNKVINFKQKIYQDISEEAKDLIKQLLIQNFNKRISATDALRHNWFQAPIKSSQNLSNLDQLERYHKGNNLISVIQSFLSLKKVTQCQKQKLAQIFNQIDSDGNGVIQINQLVDAYKRKFGSKMSQQQIRQIAMGIDKNKSGKIDFHEFVIGMTSKQKLFVKQSLSQAFDYFDKDKTGTLDVNQLREILRGCMAEEVQYFIKQLDTDHDQSISKKEFVEYFMKM